ncbi:MAG: hypothetical protein P1U57_08905, partial [Oleibacter sp.]|nr:hypothetical protein [Thalassolituus sp.]
MINIGKLLRNLTVLFMLTASMVTRAEIQFYFVAKFSPLGSMTQLNGSPQRVFLRWDVLEGDIPDDITSFTLYRDNQILAENIPARGTMSASEIRALYQGTLQQRRLIETVSALKEEALLDPEISDFSTNQFADIIYQRLRNDSFWAAMASRQDFNLAVARYRGFYDNPGVGKFEYELTAKNAAQEEKRVGFAVVDTTNRTELLPNSDFRQILQSACDEPDFKDHYSVALNWQKPNTVSIADEFAHNLFVAGFDLYRSKENLEAATITAPERNLANEASLLGFDSRGQVAFSDLERVNDVLILSQPDTDDTPEWLETQESLKLAGVQPGDRRAYYLVPRDFTGNFGQTLATIVTIRDMARPPAPWNVKTFLDEDKQEVLLSFPAITTTSYLQTKGTDMALCQASESNNTNTLEYVPLGENCTTHPTTRVATEVSEYLLYRFENFNSDEDGNYIGASSYSDSDGDGYGDAQERLTNEQCLPSLSPGGQLIGEFKAPGNNGVSINGDKLNVELIDETPAQNKSTVYWYRVAARTPSGRLSLLGEPIRVNFPDRSLPEKPIVKVTYQENNALLGCSVNDQPNPDNNTYQVKLGSPLRQDLLVMRCNDVENTQRVVNANSNVCSIKESLCGAGSSATLTVDVKPGLERCQIPIALDDCNTNRKFNKDFVVTPTFGTETRPALGFVPNVAEIESSEVEPDTCLSLFQRIGSSYTRVASNCGEESTKLVFEINQPFCGYVVAQDKNNNISPVTSIPCVNPAQAMTDKPLTPKIGSLLLSDFDARIRWANPNQKMSLNEVEVVRTKPAGLAPIRLTTGFPDAGDQQLNTEIPAMAFAQEEWCVRVRAYGISPENTVPLLSEWSPFLCENRDQTQPTPWLPWPTEQKVTVGLPLTVVENDEFINRNAGLLSAGLNIPLLTLTKPDGCFIGLSTVGNTVLPNPFPELTEDKTWLDIVCDP